MNKNYNNNPSNKFNARKVYRKDGTFDSRKEADRWLLLKSWEQQGKITDLQRQVKYVLLETQFLDQKRQKGLIMRGCSYIADFVYYRNGALVVEDVKGYKHSSAYSNFTVKKKWMYAKYGIIVQEV